MRKAPTIPLPQGVTSPEPLAYTRQIAEHYRLRVEPLRKLHSQLVHAYYWSTKLAHMHTTPTLMVFLVRKAGYTYHPTSGATAQPTIPCPTCQQKVILTLLSKIPDHRTATGRRCKATEKSVFSIFLAQLVVEGFLKAAHKPDYRRGAPGKSQKQVRSGQDTSRRAQPKHLARHNEVLGEAFVVPGGLPTLGRRR